MIRRRLMMSVEHSLRMSKRCLFLRLKNCFCGRLVSLRLMMCLKPKDRERQERAKERDKEREEERETNAGNSTMICFSLHDKRFHHPSHWRLWFVKVFFMVLVTNQEFIVLWFASLLSKYMESKVFRYLEH